MAKVSFSKLGLKMNQDIKTIEYNGQFIEIKQYLPIQDKLKLIGDVINQSADENNFANPIKLNIFMQLEIVFNYTNLSFTDKQKEDLVKLYDLLESNKIFDLVMSNLPEEELNEMKTSIIECANAVYTYRNSIMGVLESISQDYDSTKMNANELIEDLKNSENLDLLKEIIGKLG